MIGHLESKGAVLIEGEVPHLIDEWQAALETIRDDVISNDVETFDKETLYSYLSALTKIFVIEDSPAWNPNLRSKTAIRTSDTRYFVDPSIAAASLGIGPNDLVNNLKYMGLIFENLCVRDLRVLCGVAPFAYQREDGVFVVPITCLKD